MATIAETLWIGVAGILLWVAGTVVFDTVHWLLHLMLRSRWALLRALGWPHGVHHRWLDRELRTNWELQGMNVLCHLIPEYLTQLAFSAVLLLVLPPAPVWVCLGLQTLAFAYLLAQRGLDINHRPVEILDAYRPSFFCRPAYHALHHFVPLCGAAEALRAWRRFRATPPRSGAAGSVATRCGARELSGESHR